MSRPNQCGSPVDDTWDIILDSNRRNTSPFFVENYVVEREGFLDAELFAAFHAGPKVVATFID